MGKLLIFSNVNNKVTISMKTTNITETKVLRISVRNTLCNMSTSEPNG